MFSHTRIHNHICTFFLNFSSFKRGLAPVQLINHSKSHVITYAEKGDMAEFFFLVPGQSCYYTWIKPGGSRILTWAHDNQKDSMDFYENSLETDDQGHINLGKNKV